MLLELLGALSMVRYLFFALHLSGQNSFPKPLSAQEERECLKAVAEGDEAARHRLIEHNLRLVAHIIKKYYAASGADQEDLISIGTVGLIKAASTFDYTKGTKFATYASRCIENEILMYFRSRRKSLQDVSISDPIDIDKDGNSLTLMDVMSEDDNLIDQLDCKMKMEQLYRLLEEKLSPRQREVLTCRYGLYGMRSQTQREVAARLGISRSYVSRIEKKAIEILAKYLR